MRKNLFPVFVILLIVACQKDSISPDKAQANQTIEFRSEGNNVSICHSGNNIYININAVPGHQAHGDAIDMDDDGYFDLSNDCSAGVDCNDGDSSINPGAEEECGDGIDNNCNGEIDEDCMASEVTICNQIWMVKNLDAGTYRNGDPIPKVTDDAAWTYLTTGAYCYFNNDSATYAATYGKIYNWYAVNDPRGLAPEGWHIPSDIEWTTLGNCLGGDAVAGGPMKESGTTHWNYASPGATNLSGFTGLPGGYRTSGDGVFWEFGQVGVWWSSTESNISRAYYRNVTSYFDFLNRGTNGFKTFGFYVRCVKD